MSPLKPINFFWSNKNVHSLLFRQVLLCLLFSPPNAKLLFLILRSYSSDSIAAREITDEEKSQILQSEKFSSFVNRTSRIMERALATDKGIFIDYTGAENGHER